jgi:hypothetical protein
MGGWTSFVREHLHNAADDPAREQDFIEELAQHLAQREAVFLAGGLEPDRARPMAAPPPAHHRENPFAALRRE